MDPSEKQISPKMEKPPVLYHASSDDSLEVLEPRAESIRDPAEGPVVFATPSLALATCFLLNVDDTWVNIGNFSGIFYIVISDKVRFVKQDKGGTIYILPSDDFYCDLEKGMGRREWISKKPVRPIRKIQYPSALEAMIDSGVQVYFVNKEIFQKLRRANDHGLSILQKLESENQRRGVNIKLLPFS